MTAAGWAPAPLSRRLLVAEEVGQPARAEVTYSVPFIQHQSWGTQQAHVNVAAASDVAGYTHDHIEAAFSVATDEALRLATIIQQQNPDYMTPARY